MIQLRESTGTLSKRAERAEEELVRLEGQLEGRQLEWEQREAELEEGADVERDEGETANVIGATAAPLAQQLDSSLSKTRSLGQEVTRLRGNLQDQKRVGEEVTKKLRGVEAKLLAKERIITDLR